MHCACPSSHLIDNRLRIFTARIVAGYDTPIRTTSHCPTHGLSFTGISVTAGTKNNSNTDSRINPS
jgi:hypothetical protein